MLRQIVTYVRDDSSGINQFAHGRYTPNSRNELSNDNTHIRSQGSNSSGSNIPTIENRLRCTVAPFPRCSNPQLFCRKKQVQSIFVRGFMLFLLYSNEISCVTSSPIAYWQMITFCHVNIIASRVLDQVRCPLLAADVNMGVSRNWHHRSVGLTV